MILGVDLGQKTTGLAISEGTLASPYKTITHKSQKEAVEKISAIIKELGADTVVIGAVEGKIKTMFESFAKKLSTINYHLSTILWDETLTSRQARSAMIKLGISRKKRAEKEHEVAAALILQSYLDSFD